jgi:hypothetical protein
MKLLSGTFTIRRVNCLVAVADVTEARTLVSEVVCYILPHMRI